MDEIKNIEFLFKSKVLHTNGAALTVPEFGHFLNLYLFIYLAIKMYLPTLSAKRSAGSDFVPSG